MNRLHIWEFLHLPSASKMRKHEAIQTSRWLHINAVNFQKCIELIWPWKIWKYESGCTCRGFAPGARIHSASDSLRHAWACCTPHLLTLTLCVRKLILNITWTDYSCLEVMWGIGSFFIFYFLQKVALSPNRDNIYESHKPTPPLLWRGPAIRFAFPWFVPR